MRFPQTSVVLGSLLFPVLAFAQVGPHRSTEVALLPAPAGASGSLLRHAGSAVQLHSVVGHEAGPTMRAASFEAELHPGFAGQLYELKHLNLEPAPFVLEEEVEAQLTLGGGQLHDGSWLDLSQYQAHWALLNGPLAELGADGLATAGTVYEDTAASVQARMLNLVAPLDLTVIDVDPDNFGSYARDGLMDDWQVNFFGLDNPDAGPGRDPDGDLQSNEFEETAGVDPTDPNSKFRLRIRRNDAVPEWMDLLFSPRLEDRDYRVRFTPEFGVPFEILSGGIVTDEGQERTVTDPDTAGSAKFYTIEITRP